MKVASKIRRIFPKKEDLPLIVQIIAQALTLLFALTDKRWLKD